MGTKSVRAGSGNKGDVLIELELTEKGDIIIELHSKAAAQYGVSIRKSVQETLLQYGVNNGRVIATDQGALDYVIRSRAAAAALRAGKGRT